eukprot:scaffold99463_cov31-Prasinocladus_malaysianus.AAC.1
MTLPRQLLIAELNLTSQTATQWKSDDQCKHAPPPPPAEVENPKVAEMREAMRMRLRQVDEDESRIKAEVAKEAQSFLDMHHK